MFKPLWSAEDAAKATGGKIVRGETEQNRLREDWTISGVSMDTRSLKIGDLFVPIKDVRDGHDFIEQAYAAGAGAVISEKLISGRPALIVKNSLKALEDLAIAARIRSDAMRIAVTGSVGKTSVKEALGILCSEFGVVHKSQKSYNNHWGVPLTLASLPQAADFGVFEAGMNHAGELSALSKIIAPNIAVITTVAGAHLSNFDSIDAIAEAKSEIMDGMEPGGFVVLNGDNAYTPRLMEKAERLGLKVLTFGQGDCDISIVTAKSHAQGSHTRLRINYQQYDVTLSVLGEHWSSNAAACMAVALAAGLDLRKSATALRKIKPLAGRGEIHALTMDGKAYTLIDESYNANPTSMRAAISVLGQKTGRKLAILGDMGELGPTELDLHAALAEPLIAAGVSRVIVTGECMRALRGALPQKMRGLWCKDTEATLEALKDELQIGDTVLIKGSNAAQLGQVVNMLKSEPQ